MRDLSVSALEAFTAQETDNILLVLLELIHPSIDINVYPDKTLRFVNNTVNITSNDNEYLAAAFDLIPPTDDGEVVTSAKLIIDNVDRSIIDALRRLPSPPYLNLKYVLSSNLNYEEFSILDMKLENAEYNLMKITGSLVIEDIMNQQYPPGVIDDKQYPGLYK